MALVELPGLLDGNPHKARLFQNMPQRTNSALQQRSKGNIRADAFLGNQLSRFNNLLVAFG